MDMQTHVIPDFDPTLHVVVIPAHDGETTTNSEGWEHRAYHVLLATPDDNLSYVYRAGTGITEPPTVSDVLGSLVVDEDSWPAYENNLGTFIVEYGGNDIWRAIEVHRELVVLHEKLTAMFGIRLPIFLERFREDS